MRPTGADTTKWLGPPLRLWGGQILWQMGWGGCRGAFRSLLRGASKDSAEGFHGVGNACAKGFTGYAKASPFRLHPQVLLHDIIDYYLTQSRTHGCGHHGGAAPIARPQILQSLREPPGDYKDNRRGQDAETAQSKANANPPDPKRVEGGRVIFDRTIDPCSPDCVWVILFERFRAWPPGS